MHSSYSTLLWGIIRAEDGWCTVSSFNAANLHLSKSKLCCAVCTCSQPSTTIESFLLAISRDSGLSIGLERHPDRP
jgi:hypothetical protein